jgi:hypothetical protein
MLNRSALLVQPRQPFIDWAKSLPDLVSIAPDPDDEPTVYLVPAFEDEESTIDSLDSVWREIFERELYSWWTDESGWPKRRTVDMFFEWFQVVVLSTVEDMGGDAIVDEHVDRSDD